MTAKIAKKDKYKMYPVPTHMVNTSTERQTYCLLCSH